MATCAPPSARLDVRFPFETASHRFLLLLERGRTHGLTEGPRNRPEYGPSFDGPRRSSILSRGSSLRRNGHVSPTHGVVLGTSTHRYLWETSRSLIEISASEPARFLGLVPTCKWRSASVPSTKAQFGARKNQEYAQKRTVFDRKCARKRSDAPT